MGELLGEILKFIVQWIVELIIYLVMEIIGHLIVAPIVDYFFGRTRWFSVLYLTMAGAAGVQIYRLMQLAGNSSATLYSIAATIIVLALALQLHVRIAALITNSASMPQSQKDL